MNAVGILIVPNPPVENRRRRRRRPATAATTTATPNNTPRNPTTTALLLATYSIAMWSAATVVVASARGGGASLSPLVPRFGGGGGGGGAAVAFVATTRPPPASRRPASYHASAGRREERPSSSSFPPRYPSLPHSSALMMANPRKVVARVVARGGRRGGGGGESRTASTSSASAATAVVAAPSSSSSSSSSSSADVVQIAVRAAEATEGGGSVVVGGGSGGEERRRPPPRVAGAAAAARRANTGRLRLLPPLQPSTEILSRASRQAYHEVKEDASIANAKRRTQKRGAQTIDLFAQKLCAPLRETVRTYERELKSMHPFETVVMELTVRARRKRDGLTLETLLAEIHDGRKELLQLSKDWITKVKSSSNTKEAYECTEEAKESIGKAFVDLIDGPWTGIMELQRSLRNAPVVRLDCPAVVLVGAPNVGKSSIVRAISSGTPEVNNYPFTTRGVTLGHVRVFWESEREVASGNVAGVSIPSEKQLIQERLVKGRKDKKKKKKEEEDDDEGGEELGAAEAVGIDDDDDDDGWGDVEEGKPSRRAASSSSSNDGGGILSDKIFPISQLCQIMDSPGILRRDDGRPRNEMEELTLAAMSHLPTAVMYVMDLSGGAGDKCSSVEDQLVLRRELRERFPRRPWIDVVSKVDLGIVDGARERLVRILEAEGRDQSDRHFIELSIKEGAGVEELRQEVMRMLGEVRVVLDAMAASDERSARAV